MKKIILICLITISAVFLSGCGKTKNIEGNLEDLMTKVYKDLPEDERPMALTNTEITNDNIEYYLGTKDLDYEEALASESMVGSIPHSVVLIRMKDNADIEKAKKEIKDKVNPAKWICVSVDEENVTVKSKGNLIILIMTNEGSEQLNKGFDNL